MEDLK
jgi:MATE family multidrug resistance protein